MGKKTSLAKENPPVNDQIEKRCSILIFDYIHQYLTWLEEAPRLVKQNPDNSDYVPISIIQQDLFIGYQGQTKFELLRETYHRTGLSGIGRLFYKHPLSGEWLFQDGSAAIPFSKGMHLDLPNLSSRIMLSCAKKIGKRFGRDLNRDREDAPLEIVDIPSLDEGIDEPPELKRIKLLIDRAQSIEELGSYRKDTPKELMPVYMQKLKSFKIS